MTETLVELVLEEGKWLATAMFLAFVAVLAFMLRRRGEGLARRQVILGAMNRFYGCMIGIMAFGHLLAVTVKLAQGTLGGSPWALYPLGVVLAIPSWWLILGSGRMVTDEKRWRTRMLVLNASLFIGLLAIGLNNLPLAFPAALNIAYQLHARRAVGWTIVTVTVAANLLLFVGAVVFWASGQSFEQFSDM